MSKEFNTPSKVLYICTGSKCKKRGSKAISKHLKAYTKEHELANVSVIKTHCTDNCKHGPVVCLQPDNTWHFHVDERKAFELLQNWSGQNEQGKPYS